MYLLSLLNDLMHPCWRKKIFSAFYIYIVGIRVYPQYIEGMRLMCIFYYLAIKPMTLQLLAPVKAHELDSFWHSVLLLNLPEETFLNFQRCVSPFEMCFCVHSLHPSVPLMVTGSNWLRRSNSAGFHACLSSLLTRRPPVRWAGSSVCPAEHKHIFILTYLAQL